MVRKELGTSYMNIVFVDQFVNEMFTSVFAA